MKKFFKGKKIMILVPHEDDELNIVGGLLSSDYFDLENVYVVYMTNGDYVCNYEIRIKEAKKVSKKIGILQSNIIFMGYSDQYSRESNHMYMTKNSKSLVSKKGYKETFMINNGEYHYLKYNKHSLFNYEALLNDYTDLLINYKPDVLFCIDFDSHCDHRANSLIFEKSLGIVLNLVKNYEPLVYKCFGYPTAYKGFDDFNSINVLSSRFKTEAHSLCKMMNPYYFWDERIRFSVNNKKLFLNNKLYKLLRIYRSQLIIRKAYSIINSDVVCWQRRTDSIVKNATIVSSSGKIKFLNDFLLFDASDIMHGNTKEPILMDNCWKPDSNDNKKSLEFKFQKKYTINEIVIYQNCNTEDKIEEVKIEYDNNCIIKRTKGIKTSIFLGNINVNEIKVSINKFSGKNYGISEIEIFQPRELAKKMYDVEINNCFGLNKIYCKKINELSVYEYDGFIYKKLSSEEYNVKNNKSIIEIRINDQLIKKIRISNNSFIIAVQILIQIINKLTLNIDLFFSKCFNKINRLLGKM